MIPKPWRSTLRPDGSCYYDFKPPDHEGVYYPRGSICWPLLNEVTGISEGFAIAAAQRVSTGTVVIFEATPFRVVDHVLDEQGKVEVEGLSCWFPAVWSKYTLLNFYRSDSDATHHQFLMQVLRSDMIQPKPHFPEVSLRDVADSHHTLFSWKQRCRIAMDEKSRLHDDLVQWENTGRKQSLASVQCLITLVNGLERYPFQPQTQEE